jgi:hypothetical protein
VLSTQGRSSSLDVSIIATGATWLNVTARGAGDPAASATACAAMACWWVTRNPFVPFAASPKAKWMSSSISALSAAAASNPSRLPSGSQAQALDSSRGRNSGSPWQAAFPATWLIARSSRVISSVVPAASPAQHTTPTWYWRSR